MAYTASSIRAELRFKHSEWRWTVQMNGDASGEIAVESGVATTHSDALTAMNTAITNRLA